MKELYIPPNNTFKKIFNLEATISILAPLFKDENITTGHGGIFEFCSEGFPKKKLLVWMSAANGKAEYTISLKKEKVYFFIRDTENCKFFIKDEI